MGIHIKSSTFSTIPDPDSVQIFNSIHPLSKNGEAVFGIVRLLGKPNNTRLRLIETVEDRLLRFKYTLGGDVNIPRRFEQLLQALNEDVAIVMQEEKLIPLSDFYAVVGVIHKDQIFISGTGNLNTLFMHRSGKDRYIIYELEDQFNGGEEISWNKIFITVLDGELHSGDVFYIATRVSAREITIAELQDILITLPPSGALKRVSQHLSPTTAYGALCFQVAEPIESGLPKKINPLSSMRQLDDTQEQTTALLGTQKPDIAKWIMRVSQPLIRALSSPGSTGTKHAFENLLKLSIRVITGVIVATVIILHKTYGFLRFLLRQSPRAFIAFRSITDKISPIKTQIKQQFNNFKQLSKPKRYTSLGIIATIIVISISLTIVSINRATKKNDVLFNTMVERIIEKKNASEASLIYNNTQQAQSLLSEAISLLQSLPAEKKSYKDKTQELQQALEQVQLAIQGIEYVNPSVLGDLSDLTAEQCVSASEIESTVYCLTKIGDLYRLNELESRFVVESITKGIIGDIILSSTNEANLLVADINKSLGIIDLQQKTLHMVVSGLDKLSSIEDILVYNNIIYVLSAVDKQIVKMRARGEGYEAGTNWISSSLSNMSDARAFDIDGNIYILHPNAISVFASGNEQTINFDAVRPAMTDAVDIWTAPESSYLYVLDRSENRVIVYNKSGALIAQYMNDAFASANTLIVRENKKSILVTTNTQILSFPATHLLQ